MSLEKLLTDLTDALKANTEALLRSPTATAAPAAAAAEQPKKPRASKKAAETLAPKKPDLDNADWGDEPKDDDEEEVTEDQARAAIVAFQKACGSPDQAQKRFKKVTSELVGADFSGGIKKFAADYPQHLAALKRSFDEAVAAQAAE